MQLKRIKINSIHKLPEQRHVYDISVEGNHNFFIGETETLTHNCDYMTANGQAILRNLMETFSRHCRFILTCNYVEKVISPIQSRCQTFQIVPPTKKDVAVQVSQILTKENVKFEPTDLVPIINSSYPDIRKIINTCQLNSSKGALKVDSSTIVASNDGSKIIEILSSKNDKRNKYMEIRKLIADSKIQDFADLYSILYERVDEYAPGKASNVILTIADGQYKDALVIDKEITFMATLIGILEIIG